ncbi:DUF3122 domain-containing protein [Oxynema aestuarii]|jgi:hypothetical protein|uniref:DUF3122 domain-containing protein n=1 Tax=Oxynema aestuarii AP17 TaxID=2064643 RepID=A0A6H1TZ12_9CYAN|nr:DUF3122 domain-containing protein [Oxynema aestuarii]QIZ71446.1 DUF3122 domain-containing protein [Oxynema aestuarii AP17]RMH72970.1 MAG: DUF3122 domain-containing protein [Cyanobacteria bacterium J007]
MWCRIRRILSVLLLVGSVLLAIAWGLGYLGTPPAAAAIRQTEEAPGQMLYQSRHSLRDRAGHSWQVVLFKRVKSGAVDEVTLRLVGFPGLSAIAHPQPLEIELPGGKGKLEAKDLFAEKAPAENVGQYGIGEVLDQLPANGSLLLSVPIASGEILTLPVPPSVVLEWKTIASH